jgi:hypothetical protein
VAAMAVGLLVGSRLGRLVAGVVLKPQRP